MATSNPSTDYIKFIIGKSFQMCRLVYPPESTDLQTVHMIDEIVIESLDFYQYVSELCGKLFLAGILLLKKTITSNLPRLYTFI